MNDAMPILSIDTMKYFSDFMYDKYKLDLIDHIQEFFKQYGIQY